MPNPTNVTTFIDDLDGGTFATKLGAILSDVGASVVDQHRVGEITLKLTVKPIGNSHQVAISHKLAYSRPTLRGKVSEEETTETPMYVGRGGAITLFPEGQGQMFTKQGQVNVPTPTKEQ